MDIPDSKFRYIANLQMRGYPDHFPSLNGIMRRWSKAIATHTSPPHTDLLMH